MGIVLYPEPDCGRCAELFAGCLLGVPTDRFEAHLKDHVGAPALYGEVNEQVSKEAREKWITRMEAIEREDRILSGEISALASYRAQKLAFEESMRRVRVWGI